MTLPLYSISVMASWCRLASCNSLNILSVADASRDSSSDGIVLSNAKMSTKAKNTTAMRAMPIYRTNAKK